MEHLVKKTDNFSTWLENLKDERAKGRIVARLDGLSYGNFGDWKPIENGLCELRIDFGPGYRVYYGRVGRVVMLIVGGGVKRNQKRDIIRALALWAQIQQEQYDGQEN